MDLGVSVYGGPCGERLDREAVALPEAWVAGGVTRVLVQGPGGRVAAAARAIEELGLREVRADHAEPSILDVRHALATKDEALRLAAGVLGVTLRDVVACGDGASDVAMLRLAGTGVAVGAPDGAAAAAADTVLSQGELAAYLNHLAADIVAHGHPPHGRDGPASGSLPGGSAAPGVR